MPAWSVFGLHPVSGLMAAAYLYGAHLSRQVREMPMWTPVETPETRHDEPEDADETA